jgi:hypothetical protein
MGDPNLFISKVCIAKLPFVCVIIIIIIIISSSSSSSNSLYWN